VKDITGIAIIAAVKQRIIEQNTLPFKPSRIKIQAKIRRCEELMKIN